MWPDNYRNTGEIMQMRTKLIIVVLCLLSTVSIGCRCDGPPPDAVHQSRVNRGSCLVAVTEAAEALIAFAKAHGNHLPYNSAGGTAALHDAGLDDMLADLVVYLNAPSSDNQSHPRLIIVVCKEKPAQDQGNERYVALLSGTIAAVPKKFAVLGSILPNGTGRVVLEPEK
jgi:hypothetical protein